MSSVNFHPPFIPLDLTVSKSSVRRLTPIDTDIGWQDGDDCQFASAASVLGVYDEAGVRVAPSIQDLEAQYYAYMPGWDNSPPASDLALQCIRDFGYDVLDLTVEADPWGLARQCVAADRPLVVWTHRWGWDARRWFLHAECVRDIQDGVVTLWEQQGQAPTIVPLTDFLQHRGAIIWAGTLLLMQPAGWGYPIEGEPEPVLPVIPPELAEEKAGILGRMNDQWGFTESIRRKGYGDLADQLQHGLITIKNMLGEP